MSRIESLMIRGLLSFGWQPIELKLGALNVIIGVNGSGKSNLLDVLLLLREIPSNLLDAVRERGGSQAWIHKGPDGDGLAMIEVAITWEPEENIPAAVYRTELRLAADGLVIQAEQVRTRDLLKELDDTPLLLGLRAGDNCAAKFRQSRQRRSRQMPTPLFGDAEQKPSPDGESVAEGVEWQRSQLAANQSILDQWPNQPLIAHVADEFRKIRIYPPWPFGPQSPLRRPQSADQPNDYIDPSGVNLGLVLIRLKQNPEVWRGLLENFRAVYAAAKEIDFIVEGGNVQIVVDEGYRTPASRLSDGTLRWLFLVALLSDPQPASLLAIEEPELGLHPDLLPRLAALLRRAAEHAQLIVTTHSPELVSAFSDQPEAVVVCERFGSATEFRRLDPEPLRHWLETYSLGEAWRAGEIGGNRF